MNRHFNEKVNIVPAVMPVNLATGANTGDWVCMKYYGRCAIVFIAGVGAASQDPTITVLQATTITGTSSKALNFTRIDTKQGSALTAVGQFTTVTQAAANTYTSDTSGETQKVWVIDIKAEDLDIDNGFDCVSVTMADVGTASQVGTLLFMMHEPREATAPLPSAIIN